MTNDSYDGLPDDVSSLLHQPELPYGNRFPTMQEIHRALSDWDEADPKMQNYLRLRSEMVQLAVVLVKLHGLQPFHWQKTGKIYPWDE